MIPLSAKSMSVDSTFNASCHSIEAKAVKFSSLLVACCWSINIFWVNFRSKWKDSWPLVSSIKDDNDSKYSAGDLHVHLFWDVCDISSYILISYFLYLCTTEYKSVNILSCVQKNNSFFTIIAFLNVSEVEVLYYKMSWSGDRRRPRVSGFIRAFGDQAFKVI